MERNAKEDLKKFFPGKDIKSLKDNFNVDGFLKNLNVEDYPDELNDYLEDIKDFFKDE